MLVHMSSGSPHPMPHLRFTVVVDAGCTAFVLHAGYCRKRLEQEVCDEEAHQTQECRDLDGDTTCGCCLLLGGGGKLILRTACSIGLSLAETFASLLCQSCDLLLGRIELSLEFGLRCRDCIRYAGGSCGYRLLEARTGTRACGGIVGLALDLSEILAAGWAVFCAGDRALGIVGGTACRGHGSFRLRG